MGESRFGTRRQWYNTTMVGWVAPFAILLAGILSMAIGELLPVAVIQVMVVISLVVALLRDRSPQCSYVLDAHCITLSNARETLRVPFEDIADASLIDRIGAREYIRQYRLQHGAEPRQMQGLVKRCTRFCTMDIGLTTVTLGLGRSIIDRMPNARHDLVLLRLRNGEPLLLSPMYNQAMVEMLGRRLAGL
jgi:hypothetical protein